MMLLEQEVQNGEVSVWDIDLKQIVSVTRLRLSSLKAKAENSCGT